MTRDGGPSYLAHRPGVEDHLRVAVIRARLPADSGLEATGSRFGAYGPPESISVAEIATERLFERRMKLALKSCRETAGLQPYELGAAKRL